MAGFNSLDELIQESTVNGKRFRMNGQRVINTGATSVAGRWHECFAGAGTGGTGVLTGTAGVAVALNRSTTGALPLNANIEGSGDTRHVTVGSVLTGGATVAPGTAMLVDLLLMYPSCVATGAPTALNNTVPMPSRWGGNLGEEVQVCGVPVSAGFSAASQSYGLTYTNSDGTGSRAGLLVAGSNSTPIGGLLGGGVAGAINTPFANLQAGDRGVRSIQSYSINTASTTGALTLLLFRPIVEMPIVLANTLTERNFATQLSEPLPRIPDDACLAWLVNVGGAATTNQTLIYKINTAWS